MTILRCAGGRRRHALDDRGRESCLCRYDEQIVFLLILGGELRPVDILEMSTTTRHDTLVAVALPWEMVALGQKAETRVNGFFIERAWSGLS